MYFMVTGWMVVLVLEWQILDLPETFMRQTTTDKVIKEEFQSSGWLQRVFMTESAMKRLMWYIIRHEFTTKTGIVKSH